MKMILHHLFKDIRTQRWLLLLWALVLLAMCLPELLIFQPDYDTARFMDTLRTSPVAIFLGGIAWTIVIARHIQSEPVTGSTSFWLTRPIPKGVFLTSQGIFLVLLVFLPAFVPTLVHMLAFQADWALTSSQVSTLLTIQLCAAIVAIWLATYSPSLIHFAGMLCLGVVLFILMAILSQEISIHYAHNNGTGGLCIVLIVPGLLLSLVVQHWQRRTQLGYYIGVGSIATGMVAQCLFPNLPSMGIYPEYDTGKTAEVGFLPDWPNNVSWGSYRSSDLNQIQASAHLAATGIEADLGVSVTSVSAKFQPEGESTVNLGPSVNRFNLYQPQADRIKTIQTKLPDIHLDSGPVPTHSDHPTQASLFTLDADLDKKVRDKAGILGLEVSGLVLTLRQMAIIPLDQPHYIARIPGGFIRVQPRNGTHDPQLTVWTIAPASDLGMLNREFIFVLVNPDTHTGHVLESRGMSFSTLAFMTGESHLLDTDNSYAVDVSDPIDRMVLYVFESVPIANFRTKLITPSFRMTLPAQP
jgi:hypothetical protein